MDVTVFVGVLGTLGGVALGSLLSSRSQMRMQQQARADALIDAKRTAYVEFLSTLRQFRRFILRLDPQRIVVVEGSRSPRGSIPIIDGADSYWDAVEKARSQLWIVAGYHSAVREASDKVMDAIYVIAREQAAHPAGALPATVIDISRHAEQDFARVAHQDLTGEVTYSAVHCGRFRGTTRAAIWPEPARDGCDPTTEDAVVALCSLTVLVPRPRRASAAPSRGWRAAPGSRDR